jgi:hypothetical protein
MLGVTEGGLMPGIAYYLSCFYRRSELLLRIGLFINGACLSGAFGGLLAAGLSQIPRWGADGAPLHTWRNIFFFEGLVTIVIGIVCMHFMPSTALDCKFLSARARYIAAERINQEYQEVETKKVTARDVYRGIFNVNTMICGACFALANIAVQSLALFMPTILVGLGYTSIKAQLHTVPVYTVATVVSIGMSWWSDRVQRRGIFICAGSLLAMTGYILLAHIESPSAKYGAVFVAAIGIFFIGTTVLAWALNNVAPSSLRAVSSAYVVAIGNVGSIIATWSYLPADAPGYKTGHYINMSAQAAICMLGALGAVYARWENRRREEGQRDAVLQGLTQEQVDALGHKHPKFRYME